MSESSAYFSDLSMLNLSVMLFLNRIDKNFVRCDEKDSFVHYSQYNTIAGFSGSSKNVLLSKQSTPCELKSCDRLDYRCMIARRYDFVVPNERRQKNRRGFMGSSVLYHIYELLERTRLNDAFHGYLVEPSKNSCYKYNTCSLHWYNSLFVN